jgi:hypothetical protein
VDARELELSLNEDSPAHRRAVTSAATRLFTTTAFAVVVTYLAEFLAIGWRPAARRHRRRPARP